MLASTHRSGRSGPRVNVVRFSDRPQHPSCRLRLLALVRVSSPDAAAARSPTRHGFVRTDRFGHLNSFQLLELVGSTRGNRAAWGRCVSWTEHTRPKRGCSILNCCLTPTRDPSHTEHSTHSALITPWLPVHVHTETDRPAKLQGIKAWRSASPRSWRARSRPPPPASRRRRRRRGAAGWPAAARSSTTGCVYYHACVVLW